MQYRVPQNVEIEDKVIGPLTLRQFMIILVAAGFVIVLNFVFVGFLRIFFWLFSAVIAAVAGAFAFVTYGDQKLEIFVISAYKTFASPRKRVWQKKDEAPQMIKKNVEKKPEPEAEQKRPLMDAKNDLEHLAQLVDSGGYSKLGSKDRISITESTLQQDPNTPDLIEKSEQPAPGISALMNEPGGKTRTEPTISEVASLPPDQKFDYPKVDLTKDKII